MNTKITKKTKEVIFEFLNAHPQITAKGLCREFKDVNKSVVKAYESTWRRYVKPMRWMYLFFTSKWVPNKSITIRDKAKLRQIERLLSIE